MIDYKYFRSCYRGVSSPRAASFSDAVFQKLNDDYSTIHPIDEQLHRPMNDAEVLSVVSDPIIRNIVISTLKRHTDSSLPLPEGSSDSDIANSGLPSNVRQGDLDMISQRVSRYLHSRDYSPVHEDVNSSSSDSNSSK